MEVIAARVIPRATGIDMEATERVWRIIGGGGAGGVSLANIAGVLGRSVVESDVVIGWVWRTWWWWRWARRWYAPAMTFVEGVLIFVGGEAVTLGGLCGPGGIEVVRATGSGGLLTTLRVLTLFVEGL